LTTACWGHTNFSFDPEQKTLFARDDRAPRMFTVNSTMLLDMQQRVGNALAFINADAPALPHEAPCLLSPGRVVLENLETVQPT